jgi:hypothetical protein
MEIHSPGLENNGKGMGGQSHWYNDSSQVLTSAYERSMNRAEYLSSNNLIQKNGKSL